MYGFNNATIRFTCVINGIMCELEVQAENMSKLNMVMDALTGSKVFDEVM